MSEKQRANVFESAAKQPPIRIGHIFKINDAEAVHRQIKGEPMDGELKNGDRVVALAKRKDTFGFGPEKTVFGVLALEEDPVYTMLKDYRTFAMSDIPGSRDGKLAVYELEDLKTGGGIFTNGRRTDWASPLGKVFLVHAPEVFNDSVIKGAMKNKIKAGDLILVTKAQPHESLTLRRDQLEAVVLRQMALGYHVQPDTTFLINGGEFSGITQIHDMTPDEFYRATSGDIVHHSDYGRKNGFHIPDWGFHVAVKEILADVGPKLEA